MLSHRKAFTIMTSRLRVGLFLILLGQIWHKLVKADAKSAVPPWVAGIREVPAGALGRRGMANIREILRKGGGLPRPGVDRLDAGHGGSGGGSLTCLR